MSKRHYSGYDHFTTSRCERALVTLLGDIGPWRERVYLVLVAELEELLARLRADVESQRARLVTTA